MNKPEKHEDNELADWLNEKYEQWKPYLPLALGGVLAIGLLTAFFIYRANQAQEAKAAPWEALDYARQRADDFRGARRSTQSLRDFAEANGDDAAGRWARYLAGRIELETGLEMLYTEAASEQTRDDIKARFKRAADILGKLVDDPNLSNPELKRRATFECALAQESLGELDDAKDLYSKVVELGNDPALGELASRGIKRTRNPQFATFVDKFYTREFVKIGDAPGEADILPRVPDISFPENLGGGDFATDTKESADDEPSDDESDEPTGDTVNESGEN